MKTVHLAVGIVLIVIFLATGRFMRGDFPDKDMMDQELRMLMRSRHIYILFSALMHLVFGVYFPASESPTARVRLKQLGSQVLIASTVLLVIAFGHEVYVARHFSSFSRYGIFSMVAGVGLHVLSEVRIPVGTSAAR